MSTLIRTAISTACLGLLALTGCAGGSYRPVSDVPVKLGRPYRVKGALYVPAVDPAYDVLGYASWYGSESGKRTASGERFRADWATAAHTTLPLPTYVEVTALDTGRRIIVRINDRGPFAGGARIIDLSRGAAEQLGVRGGGPAAVRVRRVEPTADDRARLRKGKQARELPPISEHDRLSFKSQLAAAGF
ncbi:septal ring lytic transglycosylase RlpA family protein [Sphingomonas faeni]|uniref:septal ring lytic transglycosylase RlpA family protein n=1 Tax=Sphingomonas faeni TaxID=185950 RepID=UPI003354B245